MMETSASWDQSSLKGSGRPSTNSARAVWHRFLKSSQLPSTCILHTSPPRTLLAGSAESPLIGRAAASELPDHPLEAAARCSDQRSHRILSGLSVRHQGVEAAESRASRAEQRFGSLEVSAWGFACSAWPGYANFIIRMAPNA